MLVSFSNAVSKKPWMLSRPLLQRAFASGHAGLDKKNLVLVLNCGSSSIKHQLLDMKNEKCVLWGQVDSIGDDKRCFHKIKDYRTLPENKTVDVASEVAMTGKSTYDLAMREVLRTVAAKIEADISGYDSKGNPSGKKGSANGSLGLFGVGHRVVHGGPNLTDSSAVTKEVMNAIRAAADLAPLHNPANIKGIELSTEILTPRGVPANNHVAVFDTAFHHTIPEHASTYAIPYDLSKKYNIKRYGFHGISYQYVSNKTAEILDVPLRSLNIIIAHLGNGCSATAIKRGVSVDTTMGMTPLEGDSDLVCFILIFRIGDGY
jgi:acetate kinase